MTLCAEMLEGRLPEKSFRHALRELEEVTHKKTTATMRISQQRQNRTHTMPCLTNTVTLGCLYHNIHAPEPPRTQPSYKPGPRCLKADAPATNHRLSTGDSRQEHVVSVEKLAVLGTYMLTVPGVSVIVSLCFTEQFSGRYIPILPSPEPTAPQKYPCFKLLAHNTATSPLGPASVTEERPPQPHASAFLISPLAEDSRRSA